MSTPVYPLDKPTSHTSRYAVPSASMVGLACIVTMTGTTAACPCLGFSYRGACRHSRAVLAHLATRQLVSA